MSALPCGCDPEALYVCEVHRRKVTAPVEATPIDESLIDTKHLMAQLIAQLEELTTRVEAMQAENARLRSQTTGAVARLTLDRVRTVLATFYRAPLSMSSVQPLLTLAEELNPGLKETR